MAGAPGVAAGAAAGAVATGAAPGAAGALFGSSAKAAAATVRAKLVAMMIFLNVMSYPPFLKMKFVDKFSGQTVKILVGHMCIVQSQGPGNKKLGKSENITEVNDADDFDFEQSWCIGCPDGEQEVIYARKNPPAEKEGCLLVMQFNELGVFGYCSPIVLFLCHEITPFLPFC
jgi:hypothetical protein